MKKIIAITAFLFLMIRCSKEEAIPVVADFEIEIENSDFTSPVLVHILNNNTSGAEFYEWTFTGGSPDSSTKRNPGTIIYSLPGEYIIKLVATNQDESVGTKEIEFKVLEALELKFDMNNIGSFYAPVTLEIENKTIGAITYNWTFEAGNPASSQQRNPGIIEFLSEGIHNIILEISNGTQSKSLTKQIEVLPALTSDFEWEANVQDSDYQVPVTISLQNSSLSATANVWRFENGNPINSTEKNPQVRFDSPGIHVISLTTSNDKGSMTMIKEIEVFENTNLKIFENVKLGINTAHTSNTVGCFFSTETGKVYTQNEISEENGSLIDIVYFGLNNNFSFNQFIAPDEAGNAIFTSIPNALHTQFINSQELTEEGIQLTTSDFNSMVNDALLQNLTMAETTQGLKNFDDTISSRIVLFKTANGEKGAIKISNYFANGQNSYIMVTIKVQKEIK